MSDSNAVEKVTAFITRHRTRGDELLLFQHPYAGIQIPAGTVELDELPRTAVLREVHEETGLSSAQVHITRHLATSDEMLPEHQRVVFAHTCVYASPDATSFDWAYLRRGLLLTVERREAGFSHVTYQEFDRWPNPQYVSMQITGWVPDDMLGDRRRRYFFHLTCDAPTEERWIVQTDNHTFTLFWASLTALPHIVSPQNEWLQHLYKNLEYGVVSG